MSHSANYLALAPFKIPVDICYYIADSNVFSA